MVESELAPGLQVMADAELMEQVVRNLTANAVKFNQKRGFVRFKLSANGQQAQLSIANSGKSISPEDRENVFTRFYRGGILNVLLAVQGVESSLSQTSQRTRQ